METLVHPNSKAVKSLRTALDDVRKLAETRTAAKISSARLKSVARELAELLKVIAAF